MDNLTEKCYRALNRIAKWRSLLSGWQLGTRPLGDRECDAVRDHREVSIMQHVEISALRQILVGKDAFSQEEFNAAMAKWNKGVVAESDQEEAVQEHRGVTISMRV